MATTSKIKKKVKKCIRKKRDKETSKKQTLSDRKVTARYGSHLTDKQAVAFDKEISRLVEKKRVGNMEALKARDIVEDARNPETAYHSYFWSKSDNKLAMEARLALARFVVRSIVVTNKITLRQEPPKEMETRKYQFIVDQRVGKTIDTTNTILRNRDYTEQMVSIALTQIQGWYETYHIYSELSSLSSAIKEELGKLRLTRSSCRSTPKTVKNIASKIKPQQSTAKPGRAKRNEA